MRIPGFLTITVLLTSLTAAADTAAQTSSPANATAKETASVLDRVIIGSAASERAHDLSAEQSETGRVANYYWRDAAPNGAFSYVLALPTTPKPTLICTYWGDDRDRTFDIVVNGVAVATQTLEGRQPDKAIEVAYPLPPESLTGQQNLTVRFQGAGKGRVGGLLGLRLDAPPTSPLANATSKENASVLDRVIIGDAASERAHDLSAEQSETGRVSNYAWRDASPNGDFSYALSLLQAPAATLVCTYWGSDRDRTFDVVVNGIVVATQTLEGRQPDKAIEVAYPLPPESLSGQQNLTVRFQGAGKGRVGGLLGLRLEPPRP